MIKRLLLAASMLATALPVTARPAGPDQPLLARQAAEDSTAMAIIEELTSEIGPRMAGSEAEARARIWAVEKLTALGFANVRIEPFEFDAWERGAEEARITEPYTQPLAITALGNSGATPESGIERDIVYLPSLQALKEVSRERLTGKIAFVDNQMSATQDGSGYGAFGPIRFTGPQIAAEKGAAAILVRSIGTDSHQSPHAGNTYFTAGTDPIPAAALSNADADNLVRMIARAKEPPVRMRLALTPRFVGPRPSGNVIAEVEGRDTSLPPVLLACHIDSWDLGTGAVDNAAGCAIITAAARLVAERGQPLRTIRLLWAGAEEVGAFGGKSYAEKHADEPHALAMESDFGADRVWKLSFSMHDEHTALREELSQRLLLLGIATSDDEARGGADIRDLIEKQETAVIQLHQDGMRYFDIHHSAEDTFDKIDPEQIAQNVAAWATVVDLISSYAGQLRP